MKFNFTTRETYLTQRAEWKAEYKETSQKIRELRVAFRASQREVSKFPPCNASTKWAPNAERDIAERTMYKTLSDLCATRGHARQMLEDLTAAKVEAGKQMMAARQAKVAA